MFDFFIRTTVLLAVVTITTHLLRRAPAALRHLLWSFAIVGTVMIPLLTRLTPELPVLPTMQWLEGRSGADIASTSSAPTLESPSAPPSVAPSTNTRGGLAPNPATRTGVDWPTVFIVVWAAGALFLAVRFAHGLVVVNVIARRARELTDADWRMRSDRAAAALDVRRPVDVRVSEEIAMPFACGIVRAKIVIPASAEEWNDHQRDAVLLHEFAHISRGDLAMNTLSHLVRALYWINPFAWLAAHKLRVEGERAADDAVLRGGAKASDYADHLLSIVRGVGGVGRPVPVVALAMARSSDFEGRLLAILEPRMSRARLTRIRAASLAIVFLAVVMPLAAMAPKPANAKHVMATSAKHATQSAAAPLPAASETVVALGQALTDSSVPVRMAAVNSLGALQDPAAIAALARALKEDTDARVREAAAWALGEIDDNRAVPHLLEALRAEKAAKVREKIVQALAEIDDASAVGGVSNALRDPAPEVRRAAVHALSEFEDPSAAPALVAMVRDDDIEVRRLVAEALGQLENSVAIDALTSMARDSDAEVRANAVESLHHFSDAGMRLVPVFTQALKDTSAHVRQHAAEALGNIEGLKRAPSALIDALADQNRDVRKQAAEALASIGDEAAVPGLKRLVGDNDQETRRTAVEALKEIGGADAIQALMALLKDPDPKVRKTAAEALGKKRG